MSGRESEEEKVNPLEAQIDSLLAQYREKDFATRRQEGAEMVELGYPDTSSQDIARIKEQDSKLTFAGKVSALSNNFYCWFSQGIYRNLQHPTPRQQTLLEAVDRLTSLLDLDQLKLIQTKDITGLDSDTRATLIATVLVKLLEEGFDLMELRA